MSDYIPSTRRVRAAYVHGVGGSTWYEGKAESLQKDFDRWLAEVKAQERKRIMKLVQKQLEADPYNSVLRALEAGISQMPVKGETE